MRVVNWGGRGRVGEWIGHHGAGWKGWADIRLAEGIMNIHILTCNVFNSAAQRISKKDSTLLTHP